MDLFCISGPRYSLQYHFWSHSIDEGAFFSSLVVITSSMNSEVTIQCSTKPPLKYFCSTPKKVGKWDRAIIPPSSAAGSRRPTEPFWQIQIIIFKKYECKQIYLIGLYLSKRLSGPPTSGGWRGGDGCSVSFAHLFGSWAKIFLWAIGTPLNSDLWIRGGCLSYF